MLLATEYDLAMPPWVAMLAAAGALVGFLLMLAGLVVFVVLWATRARRRRED
jgi:hypothetical protein